MPSKPWNESPPLCAHFASYNRPVLKRIQSLLHRLSHPDVLHVVLLLIASRLLLTAIGLYSRQLLEKPIPPPSPVPESIALWIRWDSSWYLSIAENGYGEPWTPGETPRTETRYGFFPLFPLLMRIVGWPLGGNLHLAGFLIANASLLACCWFLYRYTRLSDDPETSRGAVLAMIAFPSSFILSSPLTEPIFLALLLASFYLARTGRWGWAGLAGCALSATRPQGWLMTLPLAIEYWDQHRKGRRLGPDAAAILMVPLGAALVCAYFYSQTGDWWTYPRAKAAWNIHGLQNPLNALLMPWTDGHRPGRPSFLFGSLLSIGCLAAIAAGWKKMTPAERAVSLLALVPFLTADGTVARGMPRHWIPAFPLYLVMARCTDPITRPWIACCLFLVQGFAMVFWANGYPITI